MGPVFDTRLCVLSFPLECFLHGFSADVLLNRSQQLFSSCTAKFADGQQCSIPVFDITHQTPLCEEHAKKMVSSPSVSKLEHCHCNTYGTVSALYYYTCGHVFFL